jgi:hypothetical protein
MALDFRIGDTYLRGQADERRGKIVFRRTWQLPMSMKQSQRNSAINQLSYSSLCLSQDSIPFQKTRRACRALPRCVCTLELCTEIHILWTLTQNMQLKSKAQITLHGSVGSVLPIHLDTYMRTNAYHLPEAFCIRIIV